jgi:ribosome-binding factor A
MAGKNEFGPREHSRRSERMGDLLRQALGELLERAVKDPRIGFATITAVDLSGDLRNARVYVSILGDEKQKEDAMEGLEAATNFLRYQVAQRLNLRYTPAIEFRLDRTAEFNDRLDELIRRTKKKGTGNRE